MQSSTWLHSFPLVFLVLQTLNLNIEGRVEQLMMNFQPFYFYAGADCSTDQSAEYLSLSIEQRMGMMVHRLRESLGVTSEMVEKGKEIVAASSDPLLLTCNALDTLLNSPISNAISLTDLIVEGTGSASSEVVHNALLQYVYSSQHEREGDVALSIAQAAMRPRLRQFCREAPEPLLSHVCQLCDAQYPNKTHMELHWRYCHGGACRYHEALAALERYAPHVVSGTEARKTVEDYTAAYATGQCRELFEPFPQLQEADCKAELMVACGLYG